MDLREKAKSMGDHGKAQFMAWVDEENLRECLEEFAEQAMATALEWAAHRAEGRVGLWAGSNQDREAGCYESFMVELRLEAKRLRETP